MTRVLDSMRRVPRHLFVPAQARHLAYAHRPLPIGHGQTISQPYMVAVMTALLAVDANDRVLEIGTGSGYQTAILAELVQRVYSIEIISELALSTKNVCTGWDIPTSRCALATASMGGQSRRLMTRSSSLPPYAYSAAAVTAAQTWWAAGAACGQPLPHPTADLGRKNARGQLAHPAGIASGVCTAHGYTLTMSLLLAVAGLSAATLAYVVSYSCGCCPLATGTISPT